MPHLILRLIRSVYNKITSHNTDFMSQIEVERAEQDFYLHYLREGMTVFDIGANIGELSLLFSRLVGCNGSVHAFEACGETFERLKCICQWANRKQIFLNHAAVTDKEGELTLNVYDDSHSGWNSLAARPLANYGIDIEPIRVERVNAITLDVYCTKRNIDSIDLLKIDVEGAEYQVLEGARRMFESRSIHCCVFEFGATTFDMGNSPDEIESYLKRYGYRVRNVIKDAPLFPGRASAAEAFYSMHVAMPDK